MENVRNLLANSIPVKLKVKHLVWCDLGGDSVKSLLKRTEVF